MVLIEVGKAVVEEDRCVERDGDRELNDAARHSDVIRVREVVEEAIGLIRAVTGGHCLWWEGKKEVGGRWVGRRRDEINGKCGGQLLCI